MSLASKPHGSSAEGVRESVLSLLDAVDIEISRPSVGSGQTPAEVAIEAKRRCSMCVKHETFPRGGRDLLRLALRAVPRFLHATQVLSAD